MKAEYRTEFLTDEQYDNWNELVAESPQGSIYSTPEYLDALSEAAGGKFRILACVKGDQIVGGVGLYEVNSRLGTYVSNRLLLYYNGVVIRQGKSTRPYKMVSRDIEILSRLESAITGIKYSHCLLHNRSTLRDFRPFLSQGWQAFPSYTYVVPLSDIELAWSRVEQNLTRLIRRCKDSGVTLSTDDDFDSFYDLHKETHLRKGAPLYLSKPAYKRYFERLKSQNLCRLYHARMPDGRSVATQLVLTGKHPVTHTVCAAADPEFLRIGSTPFLRWKVFEDLSKLKYEANDLTDAELNPVTRFKAQLGGTLETNMVISRPDSVLFGLGRSVGNMTSYFRATAGRVLKPGRGRENDG